MNFYAYFSYMLGKVKFFILNMILLSAAPFGYGQSHKMPEPGVYSATAGTPPPPPGLPLPIDDYLPLLLLAGVIFGALKIPKLKKN